ncbi:MAG: PD-(D/E)XK nuclease family protein [Candidatus Heimdallarchaeota archaeon]|nr:PD-(D/E)XK nuclease family protein [Candidatus Heimdallarchaeota archaeon]
MGIISHLTHSRMMTYEQCPKRYWYEYVLKLTPEPQYPAYGTLGSKAHKVLEDFYNHVTIPCNPTEEFDSLIGRLYTHEFSDIEDYQRNMITGLLNFLELEIDRYDNLDDKEIFIPKYNELYIKSEIAGIPFSGRIDAIYQNPDRSLVAVDYKFTSSNSIGKEQKQQATIYAILLEKELGIKFNSFDFWFLRHKNKVIKSVKIDEKFISQVHQNINNISNQINNLDFPYKPDYLCRFCGYESMCLTERSEIK